VNDKFAGICYTIMHQTIYKHTSTASTLRSERTH